jgi:hypothetical protein
MQPKWFHTLTHSLSHTHTQTHMHACTHSHILSHSHARACTRTHTHTKNFIQYIFTWGDCWKNGILFFSLSRKVQTISSAYSVLYHHLFSNDIWNTGISYIKIKEENHYYQHIQLEKCTLWSTLKFQRCSSHHSCTNMVQNHCHSTMNSNSGTCVPTVVQEWPLCQVDYLFS